MKIKLSKTLAVVLALCLTFAGFSAFAADVAIETSYDYEQAADAGVKVKASVKNIAEGSEVTYYVSAGDEIVYINQETAGASGVTFPTFTAAWNKLTASTVVFGSDAKWNEGGFTFVPAGNYKTSGTANAAADASWGASQLRLPVTTVNTASKLQSMVQLQNFPLSDAPKTEHILYMLVMLQLKHAQLYLMLNNKGGDLT